MPGLEGIEICRRIRGRPGRHPYTYVILVTGQSDVAAGLDAGADDFVTKPYDLDELRARLRVGQRVVGLERRLAEHIDMLRDALDQIGQLPEAGAPICICPVCKQTRDSANRWLPIEEFLRDQAGTHSVHETCPECLERIERATTGADGAAL
jgi:CheY-like chemotaxis protein